MLVVKSAPFLDTGHSIFRGLMLYTTCIRLLSASQPHLATKLCSVLAPCCLLMTYHELSSEYLLHASNSGRVSSGRRSLPSLQSWIQTALLAYRAHGFTLRPTISNYIRLDHKYESVYRRYEGTVTSSGSLFVSEASGASCRHVAGFLRFSIFAQ